MSASGWIEGAIAVACGAPALLVSCLGLCAVSGRRLRERSVGLLTGVLLSVALVAAASGLCVYLVCDGSPRVVAYGEWFSFGEGAFAFDFLADGLSLGFATLATAICCVVSAFSFRYLHLESGFQRYFLQLSLFVLGIALISLAGSMEVLFAGWELVGLSSALLVGFFHERRSPVRNALRVFGIYRVSDAAMLSAVALLHHWLGSGSLSQLFAWTPGALPLDSAQTTLVGTLIVVAVAGKSALLPFSGWLPRAMEGPTPSSAVYYGALSIHAGCFLLLRTWPLVESSMLVRTLTALLGVATALQATLAARVQTDVKSALAYACLSQVGVIVVEIALGFPSIAFLHLAGHACFRTLQFLSAPNVLHDLHELEGRARMPTSGARPTASGTIEPRRAELDLYLMGLERGFADSLLDRAVVDPFLRMARGLDRLDRFLSASGKTRGESAAPVEAGE